MLNRFATVLLMFVGVLLVCGQSTHAGSPFVIDPIIADGMWNNPSSMELADDGTVHLAWMQQFSTDSNSKEIWYGRKDPGQPWSFLRITNNTVREEYPCLTLDNAGNVHIAFHTGSGSSNLIRYVNNIGAAPGTFNPIIDITTTPYVIAEIRVDSAGTVHFVFRSQFTGGANQDVFYTTWSQGGGVAPLTNLSSSVGEEDSGPQLAIDSNDNVHVVWQRGDALGGPLAYANNIGGSFQEVPTGVAGNVLESFIVIDDADRVSIFYRVGFDTLFVIDDGGRGAFSSPVPVYTGEYRSAFMERVAVNSAGLRAVAFSSNIAANRGVWVVRESATGWERPELLDDAPLTNLGTSIDFNASGKLAVAYSLGRFDEVVMADMYLACADIDMNDCPADITDSGGGGPDGTVDVFDLLALLAGWGTDGPGAGIAKPTDIVDVFDLLDLLAAWGPC